MRLVGAAGMMMIGVLLCRPGLAAVSALINAEKPSKIHSVL